MNTYFRSCFALSVLLAMAAPGVARTSPHTADGSDLRITVYVYNQAKIPATKLEQARREVELIYREAGVEAEWVDCPCAAEEISNYPDCRFGEPNKSWVAIRIVSQVMIDRWRRTSSAFGMASLGEAGEFGRYASVCSECAEQMVKVEPRRSGPLLGYLIAHEIGHLLLGTLRHSAFGVMRATWNHADLEDSGRGRMFFTEKQARKIRYQVRERMRHTVQMVQVPKSQPSSGSSGQ
jgi:hypothetical protein